METHSSNGGWNRFDKVLTAAFVIAISTFGFTLLLGVTVFGGDPTWLGYGYLFAGASLIGIAAGGLLLLYDAYLVVDSLSQLSFAPVWRMGVGAAHAAGFITLGMWGLNILIMGI